MAEGGRRVLIVSNHYPPDAIGGAEIVAHRQALALKSRGWGVAVLAGEPATPSRRAGTLRRDEVDAIPVYRIAMRGEDVEQDFHWPHADAIMRAMLAWHRPNVVHAHNLGGIGTGIFGICRSEGVRTVATLHGYWGHCFRHTRIRADGDACSDPEPCHLCRRDLAACDGTILPMRLRRDHVALTFAQADHLISPSRHLADLYVDAGFPPEQITTLSNGVDLHAIEPRERAPDRRVDFLAPAYLGEHKGVHVLIEAARLLAERGDLAGRWSLTIAGSGPLAEKVEAAAADPGFGGALVFAGRLPRAELHHRLAASAAVVLPSIWRENEPVILMEAIASGAAIIASEAAGAGLVTEGENGLACRTGDAADLARAMGALVEKPDLIARFSRHNLVRRPTLDEGATIHALEQLYAATPATRQTTPPVVICDGRPDDAMHAMIEGLSAQFPPGSLRLTWAGWADAQTWLGASGYLNLAASVGADDLLPARRFGLPCLVRDPGTLDALVFADINGLVTVLRGVIEGACAAPDRTMTDLAFATAPDSACTLAAQAPGR